MRSIRTMTGAALTVVATITLAQSPYEINGLHTELVFTAAVAQAQKLGGNCQITPPATPDGGSSAQCEFAPCGARSKDGACEPQDAKTAGLTIAAQPIVHISLEAPDDAAQLTRIVFLFEGRHDAVAGGLTQTFGAPNGEITPTDQKSWSHSRRLSWTQGRYRVGLVDSPKLILLTTDRSQE